MLQTLQDIGQKVTKFFGDPENGISRLQQRALDLPAPFSDILPYISYDEEHGVYVGAKSMGFALEAIPIVGSDLSVQKFMASIFTEIMEEGSSIQCLLFADHRT